MSRRAWALTAAALALAACSQGSGTILGTSSRAAPGLSAASGAAGYPPTPIAKPTPPGARVVTSRSPRAGAVARPSTKARHEFASGGHQIVVVRGDTVYGLARRHNVAMDLLAARNGLRAPYRIRIGQHLTLPGRAASAAVPRTIRIAKLPPTPLPPSGASADLKVTAPPPPLAPGIEAGARFVWPVDGTIVSRFGPKPGGQHNDGINILAPRGTPVRAADDGVVAYAGNELRGFGNLILLRHSGGWTTAYAHTDAMLVRKGDRVRRGQVIGRLGSSGAVDRPQLHFEIRKGASAVNPLRHLGVRRAPTRISRAAFPGGRPGPG